MFITQHQQSVAADRIALSYVLLVERWKILQRPRPLSRKVLRPADVPIAVALKSMLTGMPSLANDGSSFSIQHRSSAMSVAPLATADAAPLGPSTLPVDSAEAPLSGGAGHRAAEQPQSSMPVLEASHRGSLILTAYVEPRTGTFRVRPSEEVLQFAEMDYTTVVRVVRRSLPHPICQVDLQL